MDVSLAAFRVLRDTTRGAEGTEAISETAVKRDLVSAVAPETPRLLPAVHVLWQPLMAALHVRAIVRMPLMLSLSPGLAPPRCACAPVQRLQQTRQLLMCVPGCKLMSWTCSREQLGRRYGACNSIRSVMTQPAIACPQDARPAVVERALNALAEVVVVGGGEFLARRWRSDAWPQLARLLREGPAFRRCARRAIVAGQART